MTTKAMEPEEMNENLEMNDDTYELRSRVMSFIYEAKEVVDLPRIDVRITKPTEGLRGEAHMGNDTIWIGANIVREMSDRNLRTTVYHELLHAVLAIPHRTDCPIMKSPSESLPKQMADKILKQYF